MRTQVPAPFHSVIHRVSALFSASSPHGPKMAATAPGVISTCNNIQQQKRVWLPLRTKNSFLPPSTPSPQLTFPRVSISNFIKCSYLIQSLARWIDLKGLGTLLWGPWRRTEPGNRTRLYQQRRELLLGNQQYLHSTSARHLKVLRASDGRF